MEKPKTEVLTQDLETLVNQYGAENVVEAVRKVMGPDFDAASQGLPYAKHQRPGSDDYFQIIPSPILSEERTRTIWNIRIGSKLVH